MQQETQALLWA